MYRRSAINIVVWYRENPSTSHQEHQTSLITLARSLRITTNSSLTSHAQTSTTTTIQ